VYLYRIPKVWPQNAESPKTAPTVQMLGVEEQAGCRLAGLHNDADTLLELFLGAMLLSGKGKY
jgi:hypothetical protein